MFFKTNLLVSDILPVSFCKMLNLFKLQAEIQLTVLYADSHTDVLS